jgi:hypothetical protein
MNRINHSMNQSINQSINQSDKAQTSQHDETQQQTYLNLACTSRIQPHKHISSLEHHPQW